ncbi:hypothetical protein [Flavobacterium sp. PL11]|uniref:hypothetical protein n=1 Tax=Flavobacterium sp. PL11 TaxID=3071717 RepID=UPI002E15F8F1
MLEKDFVAYSYIPNYNKIKEKLYFYDQRKDVVEHAKLYFSITCSTPDKKSIYSKIKILHKEFEKLIKKPACIEINLSENQYYINLLEPKPEHAKFTLLIADLKSNDMDSLNTNITKFEELCSTWNWKTISYQKKNRIYSTIAFGVTNFDRENPVYSIKKAKFI